MKKIFITILCFGLFFSVFGATSYADQYTGGSGDGWAMAERGLAVF